MEMPNMEMHNMESIQKIQKLWRNYKLCQPYKDKLKLKKLNIDKWVKRYKSDLTELCLTLEDKLFKLQNELSKTKIELNKFKYCKSTNNHKIKEITLQSLITTLIDHGFYNITLYENDSVIINQKYKIKVGKIRNTLSLFQIKKDRKFNMDKIYYQFIDMSYSSKKIVEILLINL